MAKGKSPEKKVRLAQLAVAKIEGKPLAKVARQQGIARETASRAINSPEGKLVLAELLGRHKLQIEGMVAQAIGVVAEAMQATRSGIAGDGTAVELGPDHYARLKAAERVFELANAEGAAAGTGPRLITWEAFLALYQETRLPQ